MPESDVETICPAPERPSEFVADFQIGRMFIIFSLTARSFWKRGRSKASSHWTSPRAAKATTDSVGRRATNEFALVRQPARSSPPAAATRAMRPSRSASESATTVVSTVFAPSAIRLANVASTFADGRRSDRESTRASAERRRTDASSASTSTRFASKWATVFAPRRSTAESNALLTNPADTRTYGRVPRTVGVWLVADSVSAVAAGDVTVAAWGATAAASCVATAGADGTPAEGSRVWV